MKRYTLVQIICFCAYLCTVIWASLRPYTPTRVDIGGDSATGLRNLDTPYVDGFWPVEPRPWDPLQGPALRWSHTTWQIQWPHAGVGWWVAGMRIDLSGRAQTAPAMVTWQTPALPVQSLAPGARIYQMLVKHYANDTPLIHATVTPFRSGNDTRELGIAVTHITLSALPGRLPGLDVVWLCITLVWGWWLTTSYRWWRVAFLLGCIAVYAVHPEWVRLHSTVGVILTTGAIGTGLILKRYLAHHWYGLQFALFCGWGQLLALWSPWLRSSDIAMHVRMLKQVMTGQLFLTAQLPCEAGAYISPYPPMTYLLLAPFASISNDGNFQHILLMSVATVLNCVAVIYMGNVLLPAPRYQRYLGWFVLLACVNYPLFRATHIGELSNAIAHGIVTIALISWVDPRTSIWLRMMLSSMALLSHTGNSLTFVLTVVLLAGIICLRKWQRPTLGLLKAWIVPISFAVLYYSNYTFLLGQAPGYAECPPYIPLTVRIWGLRDVVPFVLIAIAAIGLWFLPISHRYTVVWAGIGAAIISAGMVLVTTQTVRWGISVIPFLALPCALLLATLWRRGYAARIMTSIGVCAYAWMLYGDIWRRIIIYLHD